MKISPDNQNHRTPPTHSSPGKPESGSRNEERRQKACALRTFKGAPKISPAVRGAKETGQVGRRRDLSIQIDKSQNSVWTVITMKNTAAEGEILSPDRISKSLSIFHCFQDRFVAPRDRTGNRGDRIRGKEQDHA